MSARRIPIAVVRLGRIVATPNALGSITQDNILAGIQRRQAIGAASPTMTAPPTTAL